MNNTERSSTFSRRDFLKFATASAVGATVVGSLGGCSSGATDTTPDTVTPAEGPKYEVINTDLLIIGSGNNAMSAASQAALAGKHVTIVDKGPLRHSGVSGLSWDAFSSIANGAPEGQDAVQLNHDIWRNAIAYDPQPLKTVYMINHGQSLADRNPDGTLAGYLVPFLSQALFFRREADEANERQSTTVYDRTMITDLLVSGGKCLGAMGVHLPTGNFRIFRAPATVVATGGCTWIYGWFTVSAYTIGTPDNTADVEMAAFRRGAGIGDSEYAQYDVMSAYPAGLACGFGSGVCGDSQEAAAIFDKDGELVFAPDDANVWDRTYFAQHMGKVIVEEGRGTDNGGVILNVGETPIRYSNARNIDLLKLFGVDVRKESIEAVPEMYEHGGAPVIDANMMTEFEGLFHARGAGTTGQVGGGQVAFNQLYGTYAGHCAAEYLKSAAGPGEIDWTPALEEYERLQEIRTRTVEGGIRPHVVRKNIQMAAYKALGVYRSADLLNEAITEFERIRSEDLPKMVISSDSPTYNIEWKQAIENYNMLDIAEMSTRATLMREETRGMYLRGDFPEKDDANWNCMLVCRNASGAMTFEKKDLPA